MISRRLRVWPYASAAAVGSLSTRTTVSPAIAPAVAVAERWASLKLAGTVTTARLTGQSSRALAMLRTWSSTIAEISGTANSPARVAMIGALFGPSLMTNGERAFAVWTSGERYDLPISRFTE